MKCCRKSTTCRGSGRVLAAVAFAAILMAGASVRAQAPDAAAAPSDAPVRRAIVSAVRARAGSQADVSLSDLSVQTTAPATTDGLIAVPEPGARFGRRIRFTLQVPDVGSSWQPFRQIGSASVDVRVSVSHVEAARLVRRGTLLTKDDLQSSVSAVKDIPLAPLPIEADLVGARAVRDLRPGEILTPAVVVVPPLVRSGDWVTVHVRFPGGEVTGRATASQNGARGDLIRLVNPSSGHALQGRVIGRDEVEVVR